MNKRAESTTVDARASTCARALTSPITLALVVFWLLLASLPVMQLGGVA